MGDTQKYYEIHETNSDKAIIIFMPVYFVWVYATTMSRISEFVRL